MKNRIKCALLFVNPCLRSSFMNKNDWRTFIMNQYKWNTDPSFDRINQTICLTCDEIARKKDMNFNAQFGKKGNKINIQNIPEYLIKLDFNDPEILAQSLSYLIYAADRNFFDMDFHTLERIAYIARDMLPSEALSKQCEDENFDFQQIPDLALTLISKLFSFPDPYPRHLIDIGMITYYYNYFPNGSTLQGIGNLAKNSSVYQTELLNFGFAKMLNDLLIVDKPVVNIHDAAHCALGFASYPLEEYFIDIIDSIFYNLTRYQLMCTKFAADIFSGIGKLAFYPEFLEKISNYKHIEIIHRFVNSMYASDIIAFAKFIRKLAYAKDLRAKELVQQDIWNFIFEIIMPSNNIESKDIISEAFLPLSISDIDIFFNQEIYVSLSDIFVNASFKCKRSISAAANAIFALASNEQMLVLLQKSSFFTIAFEAQPNIVDSFFLPLMIDGYLRFIDFCNTTNNGIEIFKDIVMQNADFEQWFRQISEIAHMENDEDLIPKINNLQEMVNSTIQRIINIQENT